ncbi:MAG: sugar transferase [Woeseiaceae bacterium]|nr:sugar transferase [Woeseiaceae bacterium]
MKRALDILASAAALLVLGPIMIVLAVLILLTDGRPVLFRQQRPGLDGEPFTILKFRTMSIAKDADGVDLPDANRLTGVGKVLRATSLDELPELINVLRGDMSLVGPRPLLMEYLPRYSPEQARRHEVRPGVTGWAQVNGRNSISWDEKFELDVWYVDNHSLWLDIRILWQTFVKVLKREGISHPGDSTMPKFKGKTS